MWRENKTLADLLEKCDRKLKKLEKKLKGEKR